MLPLNLFVAVREGQLIGRATSELRSAERACMAYVEEARSPRAPGFRFGLLG